jgi:outer membrane protein
MTRKLLFTLSLALAISAAAFAQGAAAAPNTAIAPPTKIGTIAIQYAIVNTNEGQRDLETLEKKFEPKQGELESARKELESLSAQLQQQGAKLNEDEVTKRRQSIDQKQKAYQRNVEDAQNDFQQQQAEIGNRIGQKMLDVLDKYAKANNLAMVIDIGSQNTPVLWRAETVDITKAVIDQYNQISGIAAPPPRAPVPAGNASRPGATGATGTAPARKPITPPATQPK